MLSGDLGKKGNPRRLFKNQTIFFTSFDLELKRNFFGLKIYTLQPLFYIHFNIFFLLDKTITIASNFLFDHVLSVRGI